MDERPRRISAAAIALFFLVLTILTVFGFACREWQPPAASKHGPGVDRVITYLLWTTGAFFVLGHAALAWLIWRGSARGAATGASARPRTEWALALPPALVMAIVAEVGVLVLGLPVWSDVYGEDPADAFTVEVVGKQFEWIVHYPGKDGAFGRTVPEKVRDKLNPLGLDRKDPTAKDDIVLRGMLHLPVNRPVSIRIRSLDVLHSFSVPAFRVKQDAVPGFSTRTRFTPTVEGKFEIACAELCGLAHYRMRGFVIVMESGQFDAWLASQRGKFE